MKVYFAADHAGFNLKNAMMSFVRAELGYEVEDCGAFELESADDYPQFVGGACGNLAADLAEGLESRAIIFGASGQGEAMAANRYKGIRAAVFYGPSVKQVDNDGNSLDIIASSREHNDANALAIGARFVTDEEAKQAIRVWFATAFSSDERHVRRNSTLDTLDRT